MMIEYEDLCRVFNNIGLAKFELHKAGIRGDHPAIRQLDYALSWSEPFLGVKHPMETSAHAPILLGDKIGGYLSIEFLDCAETVNKC